MASHMDAARLEQFLVHILTPVYRITEDDSIRGSEMGEKPLPQMHPLCTNESMKMSLRA